MSPALTARPRLLAPRGRRAGLTERGTAVAAAGLLLMLGGMASGFVDLTVLGMASLVLPILSWAWQQQREPSHLVRRVVGAQTLTAGDPAGVTLTVQNVGAVPPTGTLLDRVSPGLGSSAQLTVPELPHGHQVRLHYPVRAARRGRHEIGPAVLVTRDPLGLAARGYTVGEITPVIALPRVHPLASPDAVRGVTLDGASSTLESHDTDHDVTVRDYRQGDDMRRVHWRATAHRGRLMVRQEAHQPAKRAAIVLDSRWSTWSATAGGADPARMSGASLPGRQSRGPAAFEWAVEMAASVAAHLAQAGYRVELLTPGAAESGPEQVGRHTGGQPGVPGEPGDGGVEQALTALALVTPGRRAPSGGAAAEASGAAGLLVLVTSDRCPDDDPLTFGLLRPGLLGLAVVLDASSFGSVGRSRGDRAATDDTSARTAGARAGGWHAVLVSAGTSIERAWADLTGAAHDDDSRGRGSWPGATR